MRDVFQKTRTKCGSSGTLAFLLSAVSLQSGVCLDSSSNDRLEAEWDSIGRGDSFSSRGLPKKTDNYQKAQRLLRSGELLEARGKFDEAVSHYKQAREADPEGVDQQQILELIARALKGKHDSKGVEACYRELVKLAPTYTYAHTLYGILKNQNRLDDAQAVKAAWKAARAAEDERECAIRDPRHPFQDISVLGDGVAWLTGSFTTYITGVNTQPVSSPVPEQKALKRIQAERELKGRQRLSMQNEIALLVKRGETNKAIEVCKRGISDFPGDTLFYSFLSRIEYDRKHLKQVESVLKEAVEKCQDNSQFYADLAGLCFEQGRFQESIGFATKAQENSPQPYFQERLRRAIALVAEKSNKQK